LRTGNNQDISTIRQRINSIIYWNYVVPFHGKDMILIRLTVKLRVPWTNPGKPSLFKTSMKNGKQWISRSHWRLRWS